MMMLLPKNLIALEEKCFTWPKIYTKTSGLCHRLFCFCEFCAVSHSGYYAASCAEQAVTFPQGKLVLYLLEYEQPTRDREWDLI